MVNEMKFGNYRAEVALYVELFDSSLLVRATAALGHTLRSFMYVAMPNS